jgi:uncharacterized phiE125 gp8 family phage protein
MRKTLITAPTIEPVSLTEAKTFARIDCDEDDPLVSSLITSAREYVERVTNRKYGSQLWELTLDKSEFETVLQLEEFDVQSVNSIKTYDDDDVETTIPTAEYDVYNNRIKFDLEPHDYRSLDTMIINYTVGGESVPIQIKFAIYQIITHWYENREAVLTGSINDVTHGTVMANLGGHIIYSV